VIQVAERRDLQIGLYPHFSFWLEKFSPAVRLCRKLNHPRVRPIFCGFHWYAVDNAPLFPLLEDAGPNLHSVNLCGSRKRDGGGLPATIEPLDEGELDNFAIVWKLRQLGYTGWFGLQGYKVGSDVYDKLRRSIRSFREFQTRIEQHPDWAILKNP
jgi:sugar phosphate isomerase/epimerase